MKIHCNVCESAEANVLCCADEAALCWGCDQKVHAANKLASKHHRVSLSTSSSPMPKCDICQETVGYFFCLEDRALLCRKCDVAIHTVNSLVSAHQRFLLTGVKVGLDPTGPGPSSSSSGKSHSHQTNEKISESHSSLKKTSSASPTGPHSKNTPPQPNDTVGDFPSSKFPAFNRASPNGSVAPWQLDEYLSLGDISQPFNFLDSNLSKADSGKLGGDSNSSLLRVADAELEGEEPLGQVPESFWAVPEIPSPPTASGLYWPEESQNPSYSAVFVPDIISSPVQNLHHHHHHHHYHPSSFSSKRRKQC